MRVVTLSLGCRTVAAFEHVLLVRISQLLITQLQNLLDPGCEPGAQASVLRIVLRVTRTVLQQFHRQLGPKNGVLLEALLSGLPGRVLLWPFGCTTNEGPACLSHHFCWLVAQALHNGSSSGNSSG